MLAILPALAMKRTPRSDRRPEWMIKGEQSLNARKSNDSYYFKIIKVAGANLNECRAQRVEQLSTFIGQSNRLSGASTREISTVSDGRTVSSDAFKLTYSNEVATKTFYAKFVDEYWEYVSYKGGESSYEYYALFAVSRNEGEADFDDFETSTQYGVAPVAMSVIPGLGQWYKGSKTKGICMFGAEAVAVASVIVCENQRASYIKKSKEQPKFAKEYGGKASDWETGRNISIGVAAGIWIYNIIDAAVAKGAKRVIVKRPYGGGFSIAPFAFPDAAGVSFSYRF